jgi:SAM-dependent methyltransferase
MSRVAIPTTVPRVSTVTSTPPCPVCDGRSVPETRFGPAPLLHCETCGFTYLRSAPDPDLYGDDYFAAYAGGDYLAHERQRRHESRVRLDLLARATPPSARLLEVGSAAGFFLDEARQRGYEGVGIEPNAAMAAHARDVLGLDVEVGVLGEVPLAPGTFDVVCAFHVVEHLEAPRDALRAMHAALRPGGHLLVEVPNAQSAAARRQGAAWQPLDLPYHVGHHGPRSLRTLLAGAGFEVLRVDTIPFALYGARSRAGLFVRGLAETLRSRALLPAGPHPHAHQLLRAVGRRPGA